MAEKNAAQLQAEHEAELEKLKVKQAEESRKASFQEYPKAIQVKKTPATPEAEETVTIIVNSAEEEKAVKSGKATGTVVPTSGEDRKAVAKKEAEEKAAAEAKKRGKR